MNIFRVLCLVSMSFFVSSIATSETKNDVVQATFIELGSVNCVPCKMMQPVIKEIEQMYGKNIKVIFYDVWTAEGKPYGQKYAIRAIPTQIFFDEAGKEFFRHTGFFPTEEIVKVLDKQGVKKAESSLPKKKEKLNDVRTF